MRPGGKTPAAAIIAAMPPRQPWREWPTRAIPQPAGGLRRAGEGKPAAHDGGGALPRGAAPAGKGWAELAAELGDGPEALRKKLSRAMDRVRGSWPRRGGR